MSRADFTFLDDRSLKARLKTFKALADPIRLQMLHLLRQRGEICTCEFQELLGLSQPAVSYHTNVLLQANLIERTKLGTWSHYSISRDGLSIALPEPA